MSNVISLINESTPTLIGALFGLGIATIFALIDSAKENWKRRFRQQLKMSIINNDLDYVDLQHLAERWSQNRNAVLHSLRIILSEAISGEDKSLSQATAEIRKLLNEHAAIEPYSELPENISLQLTSISEVLGANSKSITQLAASLSELYSKNQIEILKQKRLSLWGFIVGIIGVLLSMPSIYTMFSK